MTRRSIVAAVASLAQQQDADREQLRAQHAAARAHLLADLGARCDSHPRRPATSTPRDADNEWHLMCDVCRRELVTP